MWKCYYNNQSDFEVHGYYIDRVRVLQIQKIRLPFGGDSVKEDLYRSVFYDREGRYLTKEFCSDSLEVIKLRGLLRLKELGFNITSFGENNERTVS